MKHPISILAPDPANPRTIAEVAAAGLAVSMAEFGDLAGVVFNKATGELVAGHQRVHELAGAGATHVTFDDDNPGEGWITHPKTGERFAVRIVEWDREKQRVANLVANNPAIGGDWSQDALAQLAALEHDARFDFILTCPPYGDLEVYSDDPADISTMDYPAFIAAIGAIYGHAVAKLRDDRFACVVVGDFRDKHGFYRNFVSDTIAAMQAAGAKLYNEAILVTAIGSLSIRAGRQFAAGRKLGKTHQNVLVFCKGDPKKATAACGPVEIPDPAEMFGGETGENTEQAPVPAASGVIG